MNSRENGHLIRDMQSSFSMLRSEMDRLGIVYPGVAEIERLNVFRELRGKLLRLADSQNFVCLVASLDPTGDSGSLAVNLGAVFAFDPSKSAIVIDCDTNHTLIDELLTPGSDSGLIQYIEMGGKSAADLFVETGITRLRLIPSGFDSETRVEAFESSYMMDLVRELKLRYPDRFIFINAPNISASSEIQVLTNICDWIVFEVPYDRVSSGGIADALEVVGQDKVAGVVFT